MINEDGTMVDSVGEEMCVTSGMAIASLVSLFQKHDRSYIDQKMHFSDVLCHLQIL